MNELQKKTQKACRVIAVIVTVNLVLTAIVMVVVLAVAAFAGLMEENQTIAQAYAAQGHGIKEWLLGFVCIELGLSAYFTIQLNLRWIFLDAGRDHSPFAWKRIPRIRRIVISCVLSDLFLLAGAWLLPSDIPAPRGMGLLSLLLIWCLAYMFEQACRLQAEAGTTL